MSKHTPAPWNNLPRMACIPVCGQHEAGLSIGFINSSNPDRIAEGKANAHLIVTAPELLSALEGMLENEHQRKFESWLSSKSPSGDCDSVQAQWVESSDYLDFLDSYEDEIKVIAKAKGEAK